LDGVQALPRIPVLLSLVPIATGIAAASWNHPHFELIGFLAAVSYKMIQLIMRHWHSIWSRCCTATKQAGSDNACAKYDYGSQSGHFHMFPDFQRVDAELGIVNLTIQLWPHDWHSHWAWPVHWVVGVVQLAWHNWTVIPRARAISLFNSKMLLDPLAPRNTLAVNSLLVSLCGAFLYDQKGKSFQFSFFTIHNRNHWIAH
jgi:hypothetical protein